MKKLICVLVGMASPRCASAYGPQVVNEYNGVSGGCGQHPLSVTCLGECKNKDKLHGHIRGFFLRFNDLIDWGVHQCDSLPVARKAVCVCVCLFQWNLRFRCVQLRRLWVQKAPFYSSKVCKIPLILSSLLFSFFSSLCLCLSWYLFCPCVACVCTCTVCMCV